MTTELHQVLQQGVGEDGASHFSVVTQLLERIEFPLLVVLADRLGELFDRPLNKLRLLTLMRHVEILIQFEVLLTLSNRFRVEGLQDSIRCDLVVKIIKTVSMMA